ncbi:hypothetical protein SDC9_151886 [bioreactor metagenome]|uniref:Uncharacterized protein n=1 Tax=bioreactor metagenome TaxID=1076179 RepID=A0A645ERK4_9ZZZZ
MQRVKVRVVGVNPVRGEPAAEAVGALVHERDRGDDVVSVETRAGAVHDGHDGAS